jgi:hypothetical protein
MLSRTDMLGLLGAVMTAIDFAANFDPVTDDVAIAMFALWRERMNRTLEAVERVALAAQLHFEGFVIVISAHFATCHGFILHSR